MELVATDAPQPMATAVATDLCHHLLKRLLEQNIVDIKNISADDKATLRVDQNSANIVQSFKIYVFEITNDAPWLTAMAVAMDWRHRLLKRLLELEIANIINISGDNQTTIRVNRNSANIMQFFEIYVYEIMNDAPRVTAASRDHSNCTLPTSKISLTITR